MSIVPPHCEPPPPIVGVPGVAFIVPITASRVADTQPVVVFRARA
jgi:hypothetical protein